MTRVTMKIATARMTISLSQAAQSAQIQTLSKEASVLMAELQLLAN